MLLMYMYVFLYLRALAACVACGVCMHVFMYAGCVGKQFEGSALLLKEEMCGEACGDLCCVAFQGGMIDERQLLGGGGGELWSFLCFSVLPRDRQIIPA